LIISEIGLDDYDGIAFCKAVKHNSSSLPFIFFSGEDREEMISQALLAGADDFIPKESSDQVAFLKMNRLVQQSHRTGRSETGGGVSGALEEMGFMETIQILANRQKDALITLENPEQKLRAEVYLHEGEIIHAHCGELEGENVIYELLTWQKGFFQVNTPRKLPERNVFGSTEAIMLEGCRLMDESQLENGDLLTMG
jgi:CheY-like chemotaxis protein